MSGSVGIDVSSLVTQAQFERLADSGFKFLIVRAYRSIGAVDTNAPTTIRNARAAGMEDIDVYLFPKPSGGDPETQVSETVDYLHSQGAEFGTLWLDVEPGNWSASKEENQKFFMAMYSKATRLGSTGVYTSAANWNAIMGNFSGAMTIPLWYTYFDSNKSFDDFAPFGGWLNPVMKQFTNTQTISGVPVDQNWRP